ncbi:PREDICTED: uncharacterized protein LOC104727441 isoform X5 [Camelina sativa]|uniref:Uncharacterized protein LOC104727441 isoform X5 n=1 Tax=Camelina sativa TaxID=90675 RepID=A0ABM1QNJ9_CAMSA|nr:PREDICTED: uncharacterized protein LOC104727441 isoform X5 [Camelina sativa]
MAGTGPGKCLLVTGPPVYKIRYGWISIFFAMKGVGKTTLIMRVLDMMRMRMGMGMGMRGLSNPNLKIQGFYTQEMRERRGGQRVGFQVVTLDGRTSLLASSTVSSQESMTSWPSVGKYKVDIASFESIALPELQHFFSRSKRTPIFSSLMKLARWRCLVHPSFPLSSRFWNPTFLFLLPFLAQNLVEIFLEWRG